MNGSPDLTRRSRPPKADGTRWRAALALTAAAATSLFLAAPARSMPAEPLPVAATDVVVLEAPGSGRAAERAVVGLGGDVHRRLALVDGFSATIGTNHIATLRAADGVASVHRDRAFMLSDAEGATTPADEGANLGQVRAAIGADPSPDAGSGVDVALVDSGVTPVGALAAPGKVVHAPDFSDDRDGELRHLDAFGHGTHLAGIIAGSDSGVAPGARVVSVKVAAHDGSTSLSSLLAAIDWAVRNSRRGDLNIRVLNLAFGAETDGSYRNDPLAAAVEKAWQHGVVVVTAAGNGGATSEGLDSPAYDPYVIAAGADDMHGTTDPSDDEVADFSSRGTAERSPDVIAPGVGIISARVPGGYLDELFPQARIGEDHFRGSGTSQSAAVVSGAVARLAQQRPELSPDQVKALLRATARPVSGDRLREGGGLVDVAAAGSAPAPVADQRHPRAASGRWLGHGLGLELAVEHPNGTRWSGTRWSGTRWSATRWSATRWSATRWSATRWSATRWSATRWSATRWSGSEWGADET